MSQYRRLRPFHADHDDLRFFDSLAGTQRYWPFRVSVRNPKQELTMVARGHYK